MPPVKGMGSWNPCEGNIELKKIIDAYMVSKTLSSFVEKK